MDDQIASYWTTVEDLVIKYSGKLVFTIIVLLIGWWLINRLVKSVNRIMEKREVDLSLRPFLTSIIKYALRIMLIVAIAGMVGIEMTSFIAALGAAGLAIGMALQGSLANFAGGIIILLLKPFKVGDFVEANGVSGTVKEIKVFHTFLTTMNMQEIIIPNGPLANSTITNYSLHDTRGLTMKFNVSYEYKIDKVRAVIDKVLKANGDSLITTPPHAIKVSELNDFYITYTVQAWFKTPSFWPIHNSLAEKIIKALAAEGIIIPYEKTISVKSM